MSHIWLGPDFEYVVYELQYSWTVYYFQFLFHHVRPYCCIWMHITLQIKDFVKPRWPRTIPPMRIVVIVHPEIIHFACFKSKGHFKVILKRDLFTNFEIAWISLNNPLKTIKLRPQN